MKYDVIVVLAGGIKPDGTLSITTKERTDAGITLFSKGEAPFILFSGSWSFLLLNPPQILEAQEMKRYAVLKGISESKTFEEIKSRDTLGNIYFTKVDFAQPKNWKNLIIVTSNFHIERTKYLSAKIFGPNYKIDYFPVLTSLTGETLTRALEMERKQLILTHEWLDPIKDGDDETICQLLFTKHPGYATHPEMTIEQLLEKLKAL